MLSGVGRGTSDGGPLILRCHLAANCHKVNRTEIQEFGNQINCSVVRAYQSIVRLIPKFGRDISGSHDMGLVLIPLVWRFAPATLWSTSEAFGVSGNSSHVNLPFAWLHMTNIAIGMESYITNLLSILLVQ